MREKSVAGRENKPHIGIFGRCNSGKSSLLNFITEADTAIVAPEAGTTTDAVRKSYEILDFAPVVFIDTAGIDDRSALGIQRIGRTIEIISQIDLALLVFGEWGEPERELSARFEQTAVPYILVNNIFANKVAPHTISRERTVIKVNAGSGNEAQRVLLLEEIKLRLPEKSFRAPSMFENKVAQGDTVLLICPIDSEAPAGRMILPQVQAMRELLDRHAVGVVAQPDEITTVLTAGFKPTLVVTDSQVFPEVRRAVPEDIEVTSFSILLAAAKGDYGLYLRGLERVDNLRDGDKILIAESCAHQVSCEDIGRVKIPRWLEHYSGKKLIFTTISALTPLPKDLSSYTLMVQCGGCMVTRSQLHNRIRKAEESGVAVTNYGMLIRKINK